MGFRWKIQGKANNMKDILNYIIKERNLTKEQMVNLIKNNVKFHDPFLFEDMQAIVNRINLAIQNNEKIIIIGDYDCDGVTSTYTLYIGLKYLGANVIYKLPHRVINGYGLKEPLVDYAKEQNADLIITVDNGIAAVDAIKYAQDLGIEVIVTDHHEPQKVLPNCLIIDPKVSKQYPFNDLCGCGVAFKLVTALIPNFYDTDLFKDLIEIAAIGTVADAVSLIDENRKLVIEGLKQINTNTRNRGIKKLLEFSNLQDKQLESTDIGFFIGPNINAAGRLASPDAALDLLLSDDDVEAEKFAKMLVSLNDKRKVLQKRTFDSLEINNDSNCIVKVVEQQNAGIVGIIASKVVDAYKKPCFILHGDGDIIKGSGRTYGNFNIMDCITKHLDVVEGGGGHKAACGVSLKKSNIELFNEVCNEEFDEWIKLHPEELNPEIEVTCQINPQEMNKRLIENISKLKPFGKGNEEPVFMTEGLDVSSYKIVGKQKNAIQFVLTKGFFEFKAIAFESVLNKYIEAGYPSHIDVIYNIGLNEFPAGKFNVQLNIKDFK